MFKFIRKEYNATIDEKQILVKSYLREARDAATEYEFKAFGADEEDRLKQLNDFIDRLTEIRDRIVELKEDIKNKRED